MVLSGNPAVALVWAPAAYGITVSRQVQASAEILRRIALKICFPPATAMANAAIESRFGILLPWGVRREIERSR